MKRTLLSLIAVSAALFSASFTLAQNKKESKQATTPAAPAAPAGTTAATKPQKLVKVATLQTAQANREFQTNVQLLQAQRQAAIELNGRMEKETDAKKKAEIKTQLEQLLAKLNENNQTMQKAYGFSLARDYTLEIETAHIYMLVSDEEAEKFEKAQQAEAKKGKKK